MLYEKLFSLFKTFDSDKIKSFENFLLSPYLNDYPRLIKDFKVLKDYDFEIDKINLYRKIYPGNDYNDSTMRDLICEMTETVQKFLTQEQFKNEPVLQKFYLLKSLLNTDQKELYKKALYSSQKEFENINDFREDYFRLKYLFNSNFTDFKIINDKCIKKNGLASRVDAGEETAMSLFLSGYIDFARRVYEEWLNKGKFNLDKENNRLLKLYHQIYSDELIKELKENSDYDFIFDIYSALLEIITDTKSAEKYFNYKSLVIRHLEKLPLNEKGFHFSSMTNFCNLIHNLVSKEFDFQSEVFGLYEEMIHNRYYRNSENEYLDFSLFRSIIMLAFYLEKLPWAESFIETSLGHIHPSKKENVNNYALALINFELKNFKQSLSNHDAVNKDYHFIIKYDMFLLKLKLKYEMKDTDDIDVFIKRVESFLTEDKFYPDESKIYYTNFLYWYRKLVNSQSALQKERFFYEKFKFDVSDKIASSAWLKRKFEERNAEIESKKRKKKKLNLSS